MFFVTFLPCLFSYSLEEVDRHGKLWWRLPKPPAAPRGQCPKASPALGYHGVGYRMHMA